MTPVVIAVKEDSLHVSLFRTMIIPLYRLIPQRERESEALKVIFLIKSVTNDERGSDVPPINDWNFRTLEYLPCCRCLSQSTNFWIITGIRAGINFMEDG